MNERVAALGGRFVLSLLHPQGTRVLAEFPARGQPPRHSPVPPHPRRKRPPCCTRPGLLLVDDHAVVREGAIAAC